MLERARCLAVLFAGVLSVMGSSAVQAEQWVAPASAVSFTEIIPWEPNRNVDDAAIHEIEPWPFARMVVKFDLSALGTGPVQIDFVEFYTDCGGAAGSTQRPFTWHRATANWNIAEVSWNNAATGTAWTTPGGDFNATPTANANNMGGNQWLNQYLYTTDLAADVQYYADNPTLNFGWVVMWPEGSPASGFQFIDFTTPHLTITYTPLDPPAVPGDANDDGKVDFADYLILEATFGGAPVLPEDADFDDSGTVDFADYLVLEANFGVGAAVPEPASLSLLALAGLGLLRRRR